MKFRKTAAATVVGLGVATIGFASASLLDLNATGIQYGSDSVTVQDGQVDVDYGLETSDNLVYSITFTGLEADTEGSTLFFKINNAAGDAESIELTAAELADGKAKFSFPAGSRPAPQDINTVQAWIEG